MSEFEKATASVDKLLTDYEEMMKKVQESMKANMKTVFKTFFDTHPEVKTIHWTQYAPYFNDGDECVFSVHEPYFSRTEHAEICEREHAWGDGDDGLVESRVWDEGRRRYVKDTSVSKQLLRDMEVMSRIIQSDVNEGVMRAMFGRHVWVKAHRDGFEVEDYDHD